MGRAEHENYWNQVRKEDGKWKCKNCGHEFSGRISLSRIIVHVDRKKRQGTAICSVDHDKEGVTNNMASGSINPQEAVNILQVAEGVPETINTGNPETDGNNGSRAFESEINHLNMVYFDLQLEESDIEEQVQWLQSRGKKRKKQVDIWLDEFQELKKRVGDMNDFVHPLPDSYGAEIKHLIEEMQEHKEDKPMALSTELVGISFERHIKHVLKLLADDQVFVIGIYGMGGVGKTLLASQVENEIKRMGAFKDVFWVTVSHNPSILDLQRDIAKEMGVKLDDEDNEGRRSRNLSLTLETKEKSVLILDDIWKYIDLQKVGIPLKVNGIKVVLTTRLKHVCQQMDCLSSNMITMFPLDYHVDDDEEALELFMLKLGHNGTPATLTPEVLKIARCIVKRCAGLPLAISVMARTMKGVNDICQWKHAWNKLEKLEWGEEVEEEVFNVLKSSYDNLMEKNMQNCFLYIALLSDFERDELIMKLVDNGLINGRRSLEEIFDEGHTILDKLEAHSLYRHSHRLVTDMACHILKESRGSVMVKHNTWPRVQEWTADLELDYLSGCDIEEIPKGTSPSCPRLSTLIIDEAPITYIPECFFIHMNVLTVLDLSFNRRLESLPNYVSKLRSLISLVLKGCPSLKYVPPLGELQELSRLVISGSSIEQVPQGLEMLINLKWLDLSENNNLTLAQGFVLSNLTNMQYLNLCYTRAMMIMEDIQGMTMLECFGGSFLDCQNYNHFVRKIVNTGFGPKTYHLHFKAPHYHHLRNVDSNGIVPHKPNVVYFGDCNEFSHILPRDLMDLHIYKNNQWICLCNALSSKVASSLRRIKIISCTQLKSLFCLYGSCSLCSKIPNLESLILECLGSLTVIYREDVADVRQSLSSGGMFSCLKYFHISQCNGIEKLLTPRSVLQLCNLEMIAVSYCDSMKEIFAVGNRGDDVSTSSIKLPKLTTLKLAHLPQLKTVYEGIIFCESPPQLDIKYCPSLERHPTIEIKPFNDPVF